MQGTGYNIGDCLQVDGVAEDDFYVVAEGYVGLWGLYYVDWEAVFAASCILYGKLVVAGADVLEGVYVAKYVSFDAEVVGFGAACYARYNDLAGTFAVASGWHNLVLYVGWYVVVGGNECFGGSGATVLAIGDGDGVCTY